MMRYIEALLICFALLLSASCAGPTEATGLVVDTTKCIGCGECEKVCPYNAIEVIDGDAVINPSLCRLCYRCVEICPEGAVY